LIFFELFEPNIYNLERDEKICFELFCLDIYNLAFGIKFEIFEKSEFELLQLKYFAIFFIFFFSSFKEFVL
jgi:hypothetical protein